MSEHVYTCRHCGVPIAYDPVIRGYLEVCEECQRNERDLITPNHREFVVHPNLTPVVVEVTYRVVTLPEERRTSALRPCQI